VLKFVDPVTNQCLSFDCAEPEGPGWGRYYIGPIQFSVCFGAVIACTLLAGQSMKVRTQDNLLENRMYNDEMMNIVALVFLHACSQST
jgi:hypothetical protein